MSDEKDLVDVEKSEKYAARGIYLLPNLLTTAALFAGFYSVVASMKGHFDTAAIAIFVAMLADGLDGRVARLTNTQTLFGAQYDSLSDMVAFGIAPALALYSWSLSSLGKPGWLIAFLYSAATALRLARFNSQVSDKEYFQGLPSPSAAGMSASLIWLGSDYVFSGKWIALPLGLLTILLAALMVSKIRYSSFKAIDFKGRVPFLSIVIMILILTAVALQPSEVLTSLFFIYLCSGPIMTLWEVRKKKNQRRS